MGLSRAFGFAMKYSSCIDEVVDLVQFLDESSKDGKLTKGQRSQSMKKFWKLVKAVENVD